MCIRDRTAGHLEGTHRRGQDALAEHQILVAVSYTHLDVYKRQALTYVVEKGRKLGKDVMLHTHFNHPREITGITQDAIQVLFSRGIFVRNQSVLIRGVNDSVEVMGQLLKLSLIHI